MMNRELPIQLRRAASLVSCKRRALEGNGVDIVVIFTRHGAPVFSSVLLVVWRGRGCAYSGERKTWPLGDRFTTAVPAKG